MIKFYSVIFVLWVVGIVNICHPWPTYGAIKKDTSIASIGWEETTWYSNAFGTGSFDGECGWTYKDGDEWRADPMVGFADKQSAENYISWWCRP